MRTSLESLFMVNCVRYERLSGLINQAFSGSNATTLNIYIDLYSIIRPLYDTKLIIDIPDYYGMISCIVNICAHYRYYFRKYLGVDTKIFLVMSNNCCVNNCKLVSGYNKIMCNMTRNNLPITNLINDNLDLLTILCPYLPDIYLFRTEYESSVVMSCIIDKQAELGNTSPNLVLTKDAYAIQLAAMHQETCVLRPKKYKGEDTSFIIEPLNTIERKNAFWYWYRTMRGFTENDIYIDPCNVSMIMALSGVKERNIISKCNYATSMKFVYTVVGDQPIRCTPQSVYEMNCLDRRQNMSLDTLNNRFKAIDITFQKEIYNSTAESMMIKFKNLYDPATVKQINDHYFEKNPLDLDKL